MSNTTIKVVLVGTVLAALSALAWQGGRGTLSDTPAADAGTTGAGSCFRAYSLQ